jgi:hypothetical protein
MWDRICNVWLPRVFFAVTLVTAAVLSLLVAVSPWLPDDVAAFPLLELFAQDRTVRRTALACAGALAVTAFVFFRPARRKKASRDEPSPGNMAGA